MADSAGYKTIAAPGMDEFVEKRSRFIGRIAPVTTEEEAVAFINGVKSDCWDANHNVYAYILREGQIKRYSDDGEPQGTGGVPVLEVLQKEGLTDVVAVVTRYFGGILLGGGGLVRAYSHGAKIAVDAAPVRYMEPCSVLRLEMEYGIYGKVSYILPQYSAVTLDSDFGVAVTMTLLMKNSLLDRFRKELTELTSDTVHPYVVEERFDCIPE